MKELLGALAQVQDDAGSYDPTEWRTFLGNLFQGISLIGSAGRQAEAAADADAIRTMIEARDPSPRRAPILTLIAPVLQQTPAHGFPNPLPAERGIPLAQITPSPPTAVLQLPSQTTPPRPSSLSVRSPFLAPPPVKPAPSQAPMIVAALAFLGIGVLVLGWGIGKMQSRNRALAEVAPVTEGGSLDRAAGADAGADARAAPAGTATGAAETAGAAPAGPGAETAGDPAGMSPEMEGQLRLAEARVREAEARAKEAEARARQAERSGGRVETVYIRSPAPAAPPTPAVSAASTPTAAPGANPWTTPAATPAAASSAAASSAASSAAASSATGQLVDLEVSVSGGQVIIRGQQTGSGQRAMGFLVEEGNTCEYRVRLKGSTADLGFSRLPIASPLATAVSVSQNSEGTTISVRCTAGMVVPGLSASGSGFTLTLKQK